MTPLFRAPGLSLAGLALAVAVAGCGGGSSNGHAKRSASGSTTHAAGARTGAPTRGASAETRLQKQWWTTVQTAPMPKTPRGWTAATSPTSTQFIDVDPPEKTATLLGSGEALVAVRCSNSTTVHPRVRGTNHNGASTFNRNLRPIACHGQNPAKLPSDVVPAVDRRWSATELIRNVGRFNGPRFSFTLSTPAAVQVGFYYRK